MFDRPQQTSPLRRIVSGVLLVLALGTLAMAAYQTGTGRWHATPVLSGSMRPGLQPGDVVLTKQVPVADLHVRDVIVFHPPDHGDRLTVHRIVEMTPLNGSVSITTRGDANSADDLAPASLSGRDAYRVQRVLPLVGYPAVWLSGGNHGMLVIGLGVLLLVAAAVTVLRRDPPTDAADDPTIDGEHDERDHRAPALSG
jgi:signal peptidase I